MKNSSDTNWDRTSDLPICSTWINSDENDSTPNYICVYFVFLNLGRGLHRRSTGAALCSSLLYIHTLTGSDTLSNTKPHLWCSQRFCWRFMSSEMLNSETWLTALDVSKTPTAFSFRAKLYENNERLFSLNESIMLFPNIVEYVAGRTRVRPSPTTEVLQHKWLSLLMLVLWTQHDNIKRCLLFLCCICWLPRS